MNDWDDLGPKKKAKGSEVDEEEDDADAAIADEDLEDVLESDEDDVEDDML